MKIAFRRGVGGMAAVAAAALALSFAIPAQAAFPGSVDVAQTQYSFFSAYSYQDMAQTFTAGATGQLDRVSLMAYTGFARVNISIRNVTSTGAPDTTDLTATQWAGSLQCCYNFHDFDLSQPLPVKAGSSYAIVVRVLAGYFYWDYANFVPSGFSGGQLFVGCGGCSNWFSGFGYGSDFAFKTWVDSASSANTPPTLTVDSQLAQVIEGTAPTMTGTFSDPDGDTVTLSASAGTVTKGSGTWTWTEPAADEAPGQTVTITADDGHGGVVTKSFTVQVTGVAPSVQILTDPVTSPEMTPLSLNGSATSPDPSDNAAGFTYSWSVTKNGNPFATGSGSSFTFTPDDEGTYLVTLRATDDGGLTGSSSLTIIATNVPPVVHINSVYGTDQLVTTAQQTITFNGSFTVPGTADKHTVSWNFGDGASSVTSLPAGGSQNVTATHAYSTAGTYTVTLSVDDGEGGVGAASTQVTIQTAQQALAAIRNYVQNLSGLNKGQKNSLLVKLDAASDSINRGDTTAANNQLLAFLNELNAMVNSGKLSSDQAALLTNAVHDVQAAIGTYNRFLEWWPLFP